RSPPTASQRCRDRNPGTLQVAIALGVLLGRPYSCSASRVLATPTYDSFALGLPFKPSDRVHLNFNHAGAAPSPLQKWPERLGEQPRELGGPLDHELPARKHGARSAERRRINDEPGHALDRVRALGDERARLALALAAHGDRAEPP